MTNDVYDVVIRGGTVVTEDGVQLADVAVTSGRIAALLTPGTETAASEVIEASGLHVLPGAVDIHFHVRAPAYPERGTVSSETKAAAAGGVTTLFEMPISKPCCATPEVFRNRRDLFADQAYVDFALYGAPGTLDPINVAGMVEEGAIGFKIFMTEAPKGRDDEFIGLCLPQEGPLLEALHLVADSGLVTSVHAESSPLLQYFTDKLLKTGRNDPSTHGESRPPVVEALAIAKLLTLNQQAGASLHVAHVTSRMAVDTIRMFQEQGMNVTAETCPQYLLFTEAELAKFGSYAKINPPLRTMDDQEALWDALKDGTLSSVATDHSPFTVEEKEKARTDIWAAPPGAPGIEELVPGMLNAVANGRLSIQQAVALMSTNGAKRFGLYPRKGVIAVGADADFAVVDLNSETVIRKEELYTQARLGDHLYDGMTFQGKIDRTILAGRTIFDGKIVGQPGQGKFLPPS
ncbi:MAG: dihydroorotase [Trueperaceae bacterium]|nr:dihydroorotase [Trueperaceae bacterium]|tara:strand:+ start:23946 stop:25331 length:1386 start_codon:yes stop_codon:yes gene_type:complete